MLIGLLVALPALAGIALLVSRPARGATALGIAAAAATLVVAVLVAWTRPALDVAMVAGVRAGFAVDGLSAVLVVLVAAVLAAALVVAAVEPELATGRFHGLMLLFAAAMLGTVTSATLLPLLMAWEVMGATSWALIAYHLTDRSAASAGTVAFLTTRTADLGLYVAAGAMVAGGVGSMALGRLGSLGGGWLHLAVAGVVIAALGKSAQLPFSFWLSGAMRGPSPVSALLHSATMVAAGGYLLLRVMPALQSSGWAAPTVAWIGAITALVLGLVAAVQDDLKQLLAASTCSQIGFIVLAAGSAGGQAGLLQMVAHAGAKSLLFLVAGLWLAKLGTRSLQGGLRGAARRHRVVGAVFTVGVLALAGLPPFGLWVAKDAVLAAVLATSPALFGVAVAAGVPAAIYSGRALWFVWQPADEPAAGRSLIGVSTPAVAALVVLAVAAAVAGLGALVPGPLQPDPAPAAWELGLTAILALGGVALVWRGGGQVTIPEAVRRWWEGWLGLEQLARRLARAGERLAGGLATIDERGLGGLVRVATRGVSALAAWVGGPGERAVGGTVSRVAEGARALGSVARRPQTGQLHQYYAQASAGFALLAGVAVLLVVVR